VNGRTTPIRISAVTLSRGAALMARQNVNVKHLEAIENFGSMDVLFNDKTGTLTSGDMVLDRHLDPLRPAIGAAVSPRLRAKEKAHDERERSQTPPADLRCTPT
jgi:magnesium-transporting ATPase (P-type)